MAAAISNKYNQGGKTSGSTEVQLNDFHYSKTAIREAQKIRFFSQMGDRLTQPKHKGETIKKEREFPILHKNNKADYGIDANNAATLVSQVFFAIDKDGKELGAFKTMEDAKNEAGCVKVTQSSGALFNGDADYAVLKGAFPSLAEEGGEVNQVNARTTIIEAKVAEFGMYTPFTKKAIDMDTKEGFLIKKSRDLGVAKSMTFEAQLQNTLLAHSELNQLMCDTGDAVNICDLDEDSELTYADLRMLSQAAKKNDIPKDTKMITGSNKFATTTVAKAYYLFCGPELIPTLEDMQHNGVNVWKPVEEYADGAKGSVAQGEIGKIGMFRFIEVPDMQKYAGKGAEVDSAGSAKGLHTREVAGTEHYDVFPLLLVGSDSFATIGFEGDSAEIKTALPGKAIPGLDPYGKKGSVSLAWYFGALIYKPERIMSLACTAKIV